MTFTYRHKKQIILCGLGLVLLLVVASIFIYKNFTAKAYRMASIFCTSLLLNEFSAFFNIWIPSIIRFFWNVLFTPSPTASALCPAAISALPGNPVRQIPQWHKMPLSGSSPCGERAREQRHSPVLLPGRG